MNSLLNGYINEEFYGKQPPSFEDIKNPSHAYKLRKDLNGLKQAPRAWYDRISNFVCEGEFEKGKVDTTLFIKKIKNHTLLVQIFVDDIIFGSTNKDLCEEFSMMMQGEFEMYMMGKMNYFLRLQIKPLKNVIFIYQSKYFKELLKKFDMDNFKEIDTLMDSGTYVDQDKSDFPTDITKY